MHALDHEVRSSSVLARFAVLYAALLALAGSTLGVFAIWQRVVTGAETVVVLSSGLFGSGLLVTLFLFRRVKVQTLATVSTTYYGLYICAGMIVTLGGWGNHSDLFTYMVWLFPLMVFNNLVNSPSVGRFLARFLVFAPLAILVAFSSRLMSLFPVESLILVVAGCLSYICFGLMLNAVSQYREAYIVEQERAESMRIKSEVLESISDCFISLDSEFTLVYMNDAACSEFSVERNETLNKTIPNAIPDFFSLSMLNKLRDAMRQTSASTFQAQNEKQGLWYAMRCYPRQDGMSVYFRNTTESVLSRRRLQAADGRMREQAKLLDVAHDTIMTRGLDGTIRFWKKGAEKMYGYSRQEAVGRISHELLRTVFPKPLSEIETEILREELWEGELVNTAQDGTRLVVASRWVLQRDDVGQASGMMEINNDITERKKLEAGLRQSQKMESLGRLAGGVAHDFNNLLMVIQTYTELLQQQLPLGDLRRSSTKQVLEAAKRGASLTSQMLAFSRKRVPSPVAIDLNVVIDESTKMLRRLIGENVEFQTFPAESLWATKVDPDQMFQVLMNLCINSRDAMPQGGTITVATENVTVTRGGVAHPQVSPGDYVRLSVSDTGLGISEEIMQKVFEPFFTTKEVGKGTGLGLAVVYGIVEQSGGYLWVDNEPEHGACFTIYLPAICQGVEAHIAPKSTATPVGTETVLVVEDEDLLRKGICEYLRGLGYKVLSANSGLKGLTVAREHPHIDLLLTDMVMPKMSGMELSQLLRSLRPELKIILMSGYLGDDLLRPGVQEPYALLQKPFGLCTLAKGVRDTLDQRG